MRYGLVTILFLAFVFMFTACDPESVAPENEVDTSQEVIPSLEHSRGELQGRTFTGDDRAHIETFERYLNVENGGYSFEVSRVYNLPNQISGSFYSLGVDLGSRNEGRAFRLFISRENVENPPLNDAELAARGLDRLYALVNKNRKDFVFARDGEAQYLLKTGNWLNTSICFLQEDFTECSPFGEDPRGTHLYVFKEDGDDGRRILRRYRNECSGVHFHAIDRDDGSNEGEFLTGLGNNCWKEDGPLGYVIP